MSKKCRFQATFTAYIDGGDVLGRLENGKSELYVLSKGEADAIADFSVHNLEDALGLARDDFKAGAYRVDIDPALIKHFRNSTPQDLGANVWWVPGCRTSSGLYEATIDQIQDARKWIDLGLIKITPLFT